MVGLIHIYTGDGKGKSTAAAGLAVRCAGSGGRVLYTQFLKDGTSGELKELKKIDNIDLLLCDKCFGFTFLMDEQTKNGASAYYEQHFSHVIRTVLNAAAAKNEAGEYAGYQMLVLDEAIGAVGTGMLKEAALVDFLKNKPEELEVVLTGRDPSEQLIRLADYVSEIKKIKHPYDRGIGSRMGIEL